MNPLRHALPASTRRRRRTLATSSTPTHVDPAPPGAAPGPTTAPTPAPEPDGKAALADDSQASVAGEEDPGAALDTSGLSTAGRRPDAGGSGPDPGGAVRDRRTVRAA